MFITVKNQKKKRFSSQNIWRNEKWETYPNAGGIYKVDRYDAERDLAWVHRPKDGWKCCAHGPALYDVPGRGIELQWNYSTGGQFSADDCGEGW